MQALDSGQVVVAGEGFPVDLADVEAPVVEDEIDDFVELFIQKAAFGGDDGDAHHGKLFGVLGGDFSHGGIEPAFKTPRQTLDDAPFLFERGDRMQVNIDCQQACEHDRIRIFNKTKKLT